MAGFQVANFDFGKNIVDAEIKRQQIATQAATAARGQDMQAANQQAEREARAAEADAGRAERADIRAAQADEAQANRDERAAQFDRQQTLREQEFTANRADKDRANSWDDAIKRQQMDIEDAKYQKWAAQINNLLAAGERDRADYERRAADQMEMQNSALGLICQGTFLGGGSFSPSQVKMYNEQFGSQWDAIGRADIVQGMDHADGLIHLVQYDKDENGDVKWGFRDAKGNIVEDPNRQNPKSLPLLLKDSVISQDDYNTGMSSLRKWGMKAASQRQSGGGMTFDQRKELSQMVTDRQGQAIQAKRDIAEASSRTQLARLGTQVAKNMAGIQEQMGWDDKQSNAFSEAVTRSIFDAFGVGGDGQGEVKPTDNGGGEASEDGGFKVLSKDDYDALSDDEKKAYRQQWMAWKQSRAK